MKKMVQIIGLAVLLVSLCASASAEGSWLASVLGGMMQSPAEASLSESRVGVLYIDGEISRYAGDYDHEGTLAAIQVLCDTEENEALLLVLNTPGGSLYDADELVHAIMSYKQTGRSVYAYMEEECCSAGVYIAMAADYIMASRMTITGSVGVYMQTYSEAGLLDKLGVESEYIATGENKVAGYPELTQEQRGIYQALVDESFGYFKQAIAQSRRLDEAQMEPFLDGRLLSAVQAQKLGLIDEVLYYDEAQDWIAEQLDAQAGLPVVFEDVTPQMDYGFGGLDWFENMEPADWLELILQNGTGASSDRDALTPSKSRMTRGFYSEAK